MWHGGCEIDRAAHPGEVDMVDVLVKRLVGANDILDQDHGRRREHERAIDGDEPRRPQDVNRQARLFARFPFGTLHGVLVRLEVAPGRQPHLEPPVPQQKGASFGDHVGGRGVVTFDGPLHQPSTARTGGKRITSRIDG